MSRIDDGSDELNAAVNAIRAESREQIAERLEAWGREGVHIGWEDFPERAVLERAAQLLRAAVGNAAKLYEAVGYILKYADSAACRDHDEHTRHYIDQIRKWAQSALAAPPRNCENYATLDDALRAWREEPPNGMSFDEWLFAYEEGGAK